MNRGIFWGFFKMYFLQHCFICRPSYSTVSEDAGIEPRSVSTLALAVRRSNHSEISSTLYQISSTFGQISFILKIILKLALNFSSGFPLLSLVDFIQYSIYSIYGPLSKLFSESLPAFRTLLESRAGYRKAGTSSVKRVPRRIFTINKLIHRRKQKLYFEFSSQKDNQKL